MRCLRNDAVIRKAVLALLMTLLAADLQAHCFTSVVGKNWSAVSGPASACQYAEMRPGTALKDRVHVQNKGRSILVNIYYVTGIGRFKLHPPATDWPVSVRLHHFPNLESFVARSAAATFTCEQSHPDGIPAHLECRLAETLINAVPVNKAPIKREAEYFEINLPQSLLERGSPVEINWIDQWR